ncbi:MAG: HAMP domain-containing histidine kinase [Desulfobacterales bacterium]|nr:HAMP domain-containing histidine kinase [Desulfobacterales bacterium]
MTIAKSEKIKPFRLVNYFSFTSLFVILIGGIVLSTLNSRFARTILLQKTEEYGLLLIESLNYQIFTQLITPNTLNDRFDLANESQFNKMDRIVKTTLHSFKVDMLNIYNVNETISYSSEKKTIGKRYSGGFGYKRAVLGNHISFMVQSGSFWELVMGFPKESKIITFAPIRVENHLSESSSNNVVIGVVEIMRDLSDEYQTVFKLQIRVIETCAIVMGLLFIALRYLVERGERIIQKKTYEKVDFIENEVNARYAYYISNVRIGLYNDVSQVLDKIAESSELLKSRIAILDVSNTIPNDIYDYSKKLKSNFQDILYFYNNLIPKLEVCCINDVIEKSINNILSDNISINTQYDQKPHYIMGDFDMLVYAFQKLIITSKNSKVSCENITIRTLLYDNIVTIMIEDNGSSINEYNLSLDVKIAENIFISHKGKIFIEDRIVEGKLTTIEFPLFCER